LDCAGAKNPELTGIVYFTVPFFKNRAVQIYRLFDLLFSRSLSHLRFTIDCGASLQFCRGDGGGGRQGGGGGGGYQGCGRMTTLWCQYGMKTSCTCVGDRIEYEYTTTYCNTLQHNATHCNTHASKVKSFVEDKFCVCLSTHWVRVIGMPRWVCDS